MNIILLHTKRQLYPCIYIYTISHLTDYVASPHAVARRVKLHLTLNVYGVYKCYYKCMKN